MMKVAVAFSALLFSGCSGAAPGDDESPPQAIDGGIAEIDALDELDELFRARRYRAALAEVDARLRERPGDSSSIGNIVLLDQRVRALRELGLVQQALDQLLALRELAPGESRFAYEAGELAVHLSVGADKKQAAQQVALAREQFAEARRLAPDDWRPAVAEAALLLESKPPELPAADVLLAPFLEGPGAQTEARVMHAHVVEAGGDPRAALAAFEHALELEPDRLDALCNAARLAAAVQEPDLELAYLQRAKSAAERKAPALVRELDQMIAERAR